MGVDGGDSREIDVDANDEEPILDVSDTASNE